MELVSGRPHPGSLEVLGQGRRIASTLGATVYAVLPCEAMPGFEDNGLLAVLSRHGADKVLLGVASAHGAAPRWGTHGQTVMAACAVMQPSLLLLADTQGGRDLGARAAARLGAALLVDAWLEIEGENLVLWEGSGEHAKRLESELDFTVVALVPPGRYAIAEGDEEAEAEVLDLSEPWVDFTAVDEAEAGVAPVVAGAGAGAEHLAGALGGVLVPPGGGSASSLPAPLAVSIGAAVAATAERAVVLGESAVPAAGATTPSYTVDARPNQPLDDIAEELARALDEVLGPHVEGSPLPRSRR